jgi:hypothetical protein
MSNDIVSKSGTVVGQWDGKDCHDLKNEMEKIKKRLKAEGRRDEVLKQGVPHQDQIPEDLKTFTAYPIWAIDAKGNALVGAGANRVISLENLRTYSLYEHH